MSGPARIWLGIASDTFDVCAWSYDDAKPSDWPGELYLRATPELIALIGMAPHEPKGVGPDYEWWRSRVLNRALTFIRRNHSAD